MARIWIIPLTLATAAVHFSFFLPDPRGELIYGLNALGFIVLLVLLYLPLPILDPFRHLVRWVFILYTGLTIAAYFAAGILIREWTIPLGPVTKLIEVALIGLLWMEGRRHS